MVSDYSHDTTKTLWCDGPRIDKVSSPYRIEARPAWGGNFFAFQF